MAERQKGMGRGLAAILSAAPKDEAEELRQLPVELIAPNPAPAAADLRRGRRCSRSPTRSAPAACCSRCSSGPVAGGRYELIAGERRWRAARLAELETIPAIVRHHDDAASLELALIENMAREDLNPVEEARACAALVEELGLTREEVGLRVGRSRVAVSNLIRLLDLPDEALELIERGELTEGHGRALLLTEDHAERRGLARGAVDGQWSVRELEARARAGAEARPSPEPARRPKRRLHPDQEAAIEQIADALAAALGAEVEVVPAPGHGYRVEISFASLDEALELAGDCGYARWREPSVQGSPPRSENPWVRSRGGRTRFGTISRCSRSPARGD